MAASTPLQDRDTGTSDPSYTKLHTTNLPWYTEDVSGQLHPSIHQQFETYSNIPPADVIPHIRSIRTKLWDIRAYPCTGLYVFLVPWVRYHSAFEAVVERLKKTQDAKVLDVGCYVGHDLRALGFAGVKQEALYGLDILPFWELGWELFNDKEKFDMEGRYVVGDILDSGSESEAAKLLDGKMDVVWSSAVIHQFPWDKAVLACKRMIQYTKGPGSFIFGCIVGSSQDEGPVEMEKMTKVKTDGTKPFRHNASSMKRLWMEVAEGVGLKIEVEAKVGKWEDYGCDPERCKVMGPDVGILDYSVKIL